MTAYISPFSINYLHLRSPWIPAWWSAAFPGYGHFMLCKYVTAYILMAWEIFINSGSKLNTAIYYSMIGNFTKASHVLNKEWILLYIPVFVFSIWDCFRRTVQYNQDYILGFREQEQEATHSVNISTLELNTLDKRKPWIAVTWSLMFPGLGHLYLNRLPAVVFGTIWLVVIVHFGHILPAIHYTFYGQFAMAKSVLDPQWLLYIPSVYGFFAYDAYVNAVEYNKLYEREQTKYLVNNYQYPHFTYPL